MNPKDLENILFLDIETVPAIQHYRDLEPRARELWDRKWQFQKDLSAEEQYARAGIYAEFAKVICIGYGMFKHGRLTVHTMSGDDEQKLLKEFSDLLRRAFNHERYLLCAHNGKEFDFPFLIRRMLVNSVEIPGILQLQGKKPWDVKHLDTMEMWKFGDYKNYSSLNLLSYVFGIPSPKDDMDGSKVAAAYYEEKALDKIVRYCSRDVATLARVFCRLVSLPDLKEDQIIFA